MVSKLMNQHMCGQCGRDTNTVWRGGMVINILSVYVRCDQKDIVRDYSSERDGQNKTFVDMDEVGPRGIGIKS